MSLRRFAFPLLLAALAQAACAASSDTSCRYGAECPSGVCNADGTCQPADTSSSSSGGSSSSAGGGGAGGTGGASSSSSSSSSSGTGAGGGGVCSPNKDGVITRDEVPLGPGLHATFKVAEDVTVDSAGEAQPDGSRIWDLTAMLPGDHGALVETLPLAGQWFEMDFPGASYAARLSQGADLLGVFEITDTELLLRGVVSPTAGFAQTKLTYDPAVVVLAFPLEKGKTWSTASTVSGQLNGVFGFYNETYSNEVGAHGTLKTPFGSLPVLRIGISLTRVAGAIVTTKRTFAFTSECFGTVGNIVSQDNELGDEFTNAAEVTRLSP